MTQTTFANNVNCFTGLPAHLTRSIMARNPRKLSREQVDEVRAMHNSGMSYREIGEKKHLSRNLIFHVVRWRGAYAGML